SSYADSDELTALCEVVREYGGFYATHLRNEEDELEEAVQEALTVAERATVPLQLSHHKAEGAFNWGKVNRTLRMVEKARDSGLDVQLDQYPYTAFMTGLAIQCLPVSLRGRSPEQLSAMLNDASQRADVARMILEAHPTWSERGEHSFFSNVQIGVCRAKPQLQGYTIAALAAIAGCEPLEYMLDLLRDTGGYVSAVNFAISEEDIATVMRFPWTSIGSDGLGTRPEGAAAADLIHPRAYGAFPRVLGRYARELGVISEQEAVWKMTGLPAQRLGLSRKGAIKVGYDADITVYNRQTVRDRATFAEPHQYAQGIEFVLVNGRFALREGELTGALSGKILRPSLDRAGR
ncbi:MAG TPA: amidohydrolase family protein, partial [Chthonomonadales bacterium]|nr:amidohydrolase family protein [Chthonomonadales bacterium]